jgi:hypothetical protein
MSMALVPCHEPEPRRHLFSRSRTRVSTWRATCQTSSDLHFGCTGLLSASAETSSDDGSAEKVCRISSTSSGLVDLNATIYAKVAPDKAPPVTSAWRNQRYPPSRCHRDLASNSTAPTLMFPSAHRSRTSTIPGRAPSTPAQNYTYGHRASRKYRKWSTWHGACEGES